MIQKNNRKDNGILKHIISVDKNENGEIIAEMHFLQKKRVAALQKCIFTKKNLF